MAEIVAVMNDKAGKRFAASSASGVRYAVTSGAGHFGGYDPDFKWNGWKTDEGGWYHALGREVA